MSGDETTGLIAEARARQYQWYYTSSHPTAVEGREYRRVMILLADELERLQRAESTSKAQWQAEALNEVGDKADVVGATMFGKWPHDSAAALLAPTTENGETT